MWFKSSVVTLSNSTQFERRMFVGSLLTEQEIDRNDKKSVSLKSEVFIA